MQSTDLDALVGSLPLDAQQIVASALPEVAHRLTPVAVREWVQAIQLLLDAGAGMSAIVTYSRSVPVVAYEAGEAYLAQIVRVSLSLLKRADGRALDKFLDSLPQAVRRLRQPSALQAYLDVVEELAALAPAGLASMFERLGQILDQVSLDGLRRWALLGVQAQTRDPSAQSAWFRLDSQDARVILRAAGEGALFADVERRLGFYLRALWAREPALRAAVPRPDSNKGMRVSIVDGTIRMPLAIEVFPGQDSVTLYRAAAAHAAAHLTYSTERFPRRSLRSIQVALISLIEDARVERLAMQKMPGLRNLWQPFHIALPSFVMTGVSLMARLSRALIDETYEDDNALVVKGRAMFAQASDRMTDPALSREIGNLLGNDLGQMRVQFNFKTYLVEPLYRDDNMFLWDMGQTQPQRSEDDEFIEQAVNLQPGEAGEDVDLEIERGAGEITEGDADERDSDGPEEQLVVAPLAQPYHYDEWDYLIGMDRPAWCTLLEKPAPSGDPRTIDAVLRRNEDVVNRLTSVIRAVQIQRPLRLKKQLEGDRLDIDACIGAMVDMRSKRVPDPRVQQRIVRNNRDLDVLLLLDLSQSTNDWVPSAQSTVLALEREATVLVAHAMDKLGDNFAIHGFDSNGRSDVEYYRFKEFDEPYGDDARARLAGMKGQLSTRMGTALRHAGHFLRNRRTAQKLILLLTDGEPHDIDVHDKRYLMFDAKRAVEDQRRYGIATFCLSLDHKADEYVARIFGSRNYLVLDELRRLPEKLPSLYLRLTT